MLGRVVAGAVVGAALGAAWWGVREFIAAGAVCSKDEWNCLAMGLFAIPVSLVVGVLLGWFVLALLRVQRPLGMAAVGMTFAAVLTLTTVWISIPASGVLAGALGFVLAAPVTARHPVGDNAGRD
ncbi:hypothetical protein ABZ816_06585 [Actinosynnema sp. NPDC047251]|uniref:Uncharacterized protein n=1 Tax=Saccharothrix espanaensis (strain ATCC 51144 / DSM 44229 / JCM 9112 / NBRC 15066 / NRRL 15764) TaxID=1179773 RepID=K0JUF6_SACES|nr:hypothetical protein [Saccharothrix espanaensis]CCH27878.1 hypothetical protein BN6_05470 [Saccharothrix espanaensis DSM 44229]